MAYTQEEQIRYALKIEGTERFKISAAVTDKGDLPDASIFVAEIMIPNDSKNDLFARVCQVSDFNNIRTDRIGAVAAGEQYYRKSAHIFYYDTLDVAVAAQTVLKENIDELVTNWQTYQTQFVTVSEIISHPRVDEAIYTVAVNAYNTAHSSTVTAQTALATGKTAYDSAVATASTKATDITVAQTRYDTIIKLQGYFSSLRSELVGLKSAGDTYYNAKHASPVDSTDNTFATALIAAQNALNGNASQQQEMSAFKEALSTELSAAITAKTAADLTVASKKTEYESAKAAYASAVQAEEAALAAVRALKPSFDPAG